MASITNQITNNKQMIILIFNSKENKQMSLASTVTDCMTYMNKKDPVKVGCLKMIQKTTLASNMLGPKVISKMIGQRLKIFRSRSNYSLIILRRASTNTGQRHQWSLNRFNFKSSKNSMLQVVEIGLELLNHPSLSNPNKLRFITTHTDRTTGKTSRN